MRAAIVGIVLLTVVAAPAYAQSREREGRSATKVIVGTGAIVLGAFIAANAGETKTVTSTTGSTTTSSFSGSQLGIGLGMAGVGGYLLWDGLRTRDDRYPSTTVGVGVGRRGTGLFVRRRW